MATQQYGCSLEGRRCRCPTADEWLKCEHFGPIDPMVVDEGYCTEPGSNRHNPYSSSKPITTAQWGHL